MEAEAPSGAPPRRPRTSLLVLLAIAAAAFAFVSLRDSAGPAPQASNPGRPAPQGGERTNPQELDVRVEKLEKELPAPDDTERNPFRFRPKPPPPAPPAPKRPPQAELAPPVPEGPKPPPPIPLKFIGVTEAPGIGKIAALTDCRHTVQGVEGQEIEGRYRIVKIGVESLIIEYLDGKGRTTLRMSGQECVGK